MKLNFANFGNEKLLIFVSLLIFTIFVSASCISAAHCDNDCSLVDSDCSLVDSDCSLVDDNSTEIHQNDDLDDYNIIDLKDSKYQRIIERQGGLENNVSKSGIILDDNNDFTMSVKYNAGTGYHWEVSDDSYGISINSVDYSVDHPGCCGSSGSQYFNIHANSDDFYVKLVLISHQVIS